MWMKTLFNWRRQKITEWFTNEEASTLGLNFAKSRGSTGVTAKEVALVLQRLGQFRIHGLLFQLALRGDLEVEWSEDKEDILFLDKNIFMEGKDN